MKFLAPIPSQFLDETGTPYSSGSVSVYIHGEPRLADIYQNASGNELAPNPFTLDSHGMWMAFVDSGKSYDYLVKDAGGNVVAPYYNVVVPGTEGVSGVSIESPRGSIEVTESVVGGRKEFGIDVNADSFAHSHGSFSHDAVVGASGSFDYDSFAEVGVEGDDIYLSQGRLTLDSGLYHVSVNVLLENSAEDGNSYDVSFEIDGTQFKKSWDNTFVHSETVEVGIDISVDEDGHAVVPSISGLPEGMSCGIPRLDVHRVDGLCVGSSSSTVEHDSTIEGDGSHDNPLSVKDYSSIRSDLAGVIEDLADHETDPGAHQDIRNELSLKEDKSNKVTEWSETLSDDKYPSERLVKESLDNLPPGTAVKGDAENEYRTGNVNLTPANIGAATTAQGAKADSAIQGVSVNGTALTPDSGNVVDVSVPTSSNATPLMDGTAAAGVGTHWARGDHRHPTDTSREAVNNKVQSIDDSSTTEYPSSKAVADFVNSSVATNTATFLGNFSLEDLDLTYPATEVQLATALNSHTWPTGYPTNNDYVYVEIRNPQSTIDDKVQRYKYRDGLASWGYEYTLNNSSFTAEEKASIDSGITSQDVTNLRADHTTLDTHVGDGNIHVTSSEKNAWNGKYTKPSTGIPKTDLASGVQTSLGLADSALQAHQSVTDSNPTLAWGTQSKVGSVGSTDLHVTMPSNPASGKLDTTGDASDTTSIFTKAIDDTSSMASGVKLSVIFTAISSFFASLKSLAFKDKASYSDLLSDVQYSLDKADSALQPSGNGSNLSVTPDGTSTGTDIGSSTTLMAWAQKFKNLVASLGTAAFKNVPSSGNASTSEVVMGNDTRLTDARTPTSHTHDDRYYTESEVNTLLNNKLNTNGDASNTTVTRDGTTTGVDIPSSALALNAFAQKVKNISDTLNTSVLYGYCPTAASSMAKRVNVYNSNVIRLSNYRLVCIHFQNGNTYNDASNDIVFNFYRDDTLWFTKSTRATGWLNHIVAGDYLFVVGPGETEMGFIKSYTQDTNNAEYAKNYIAGGTIASELASLASSISSKQDALPTSGGAYAIDITGNAATAGSCANASNAGYASTAGRTTSAYSWLDYIGAGGRKCFEAFKLDTLGVGNYIQGVVTIFVRTSGNAFKSYNVSFVCYRESGSTYSGKINKHEIANTDSSISVDVYLVTQASIGRVSVVAVVIYNDSSGGRYVAGYASGICINDGAVVSNNVGATVADVVPNMTLIDAI